MNTGVAKTIKSRFIKERFTEYSGVHSYKERFDI